MVGHQVVVSGRQGSNPGLHPKKNLLCLPTKNSWAPSCCIGEVLPGVVAGFRGFLTQFGWDIFSVQSRWGSPVEFFLSIFVYEEIVDTMHSLIDFFAYIKLCEDLLGSTKSVRTVLDLTTIPVIQPYFSKAVHFTELCVT